MASLSFIVDRNHFENEAFRRCRQDQHVRDSPAQVFLTDTNPKRMVIFTFSNFSGVAWPGWGLKKAIAFVYI